MANSKEIFISFDKCFENIHVLYSPEWTKTGGFFTPLFVDFTYVKTVHSYSQFVKIHILKYICASGADTGFQSGGGEIF